jgi:hypothetical protein
LLTDSTPKKGEQEARVTRQVGWDLRQQFETRDGCVCIVSEGYGLRTVDEYAPRPKMITYTPRMIVWLLPVLVNARISCRAGFRTIGPPQSQGYLPVTISKCSNTVIPSFFGGDIVDLRSQGGRSAYLLES